MGTNGQLDPQDLARVQKYRYMDDDFMTVCFDENYEAAELVLRIVMEKHDLKVHDFSCENPDDMNFEELAKKARYFKRDEKGVSAMCKMMEDLKVPVMA